MTEQKKGVDKFSAAADKFFGEVASQLEESVKLQDIQGIQRATAISELIYKVNQSIKLMRDDPKAKKEDGELNGSRVDRFANKKRDA